MPPESTYCATKSPKASSKLVPSGLPLSAASTTAADFKLALSASASAPLMASASVKSTIGNSVTSPSKPKRSAIW